MHHISLVSRAFVEEKGSGDEASTVCACVKQKTWESER